MVVVASTVGILRIRTAHPLLDDRVDELAHAGSDRRVALGRRLPAEVGERVGDPGFLFVRAHSRGVFDGPSCPECGSTYLVVRLRTHGYPRSGDGPGAARLYRCFRCFNKFTPDEISPEA
jgi:DNA-directed RNA polymerase subunit RPC12/RpoP